MDGREPIIVSAEIMMGLQLIIARQTNLTKEAAVISIGKIQGGVRNNIIPEEVEMVGTIRTLDTAMQTKIHKDIYRTATKIAESFGAEAVVEIEIGYPVTFNNLELTRKMLPTLFRVAGEDNVLLLPPITGAEDFSFYAQQVPGLFFFLGAMPEGTTIFEAAPHHTPDFFVDESSFKLGMRSLCNLALDYMEANK